MSEEPVSREEILKAAKELGIDACTLSYRGFLKGRMKITWALVDRKTMERPIEDWAAIFGQILHKTSDVLREERRKCQV